MRLQLQFREFLFDWIMIITAVTFFRLVFDPNFSRGAVPNLNIVIFAFAPILSVVYFHCLTFDRFWIKIVFSIALGFLSACLLVLWIIATGAF